jgi:hypothetical protein
VTLAGWFRQAHARPLPPTVLEEIEALEAEEQEEDDDEG